MADYFIICSNCEATYGYYPKTEGTIITIAGITESIITNADLPKKPVCPKCKRDDCTKWIVAMG